MDHNHEQAIRKSKISTDNPRDIAECIDQLIRERIGGALIEFGLATETGPHDRSERIELLKRRISDYLLVTDPRKGVFHGE